MAWTVGDWWSTGSGGTFRGGDPFSPAIGDDISIATGGWWMGLITETWAHVCYLIPGEEVKGLNVPKGKIRVVVDGANGDICRFLKLSYTDRE